jgi:hypothetical protein
MHYIKYLIASFMFFMAGCIKFDRVPDQGSQANMGSVENVMANNGCYGSKAIGAFVLCAVIFLGLGLLIGKKK